MLKSGENIELQRHYASDAVSSHLQNLQLTPSSLESCSCLVHTSTKYSEPSQRCKAGNMIARISAMIVENIYSSFGEDVHISTVICA